jgi:oligopeptide/dipeptide ABC transporter ATP-binding protein
MGDSLLKIKNMTMGFVMKNSVFIAVDSMNLAMEHGEILGLVGESGSGKTQAMLAVMRLIQQPGKILSGEILFKGKDLLRKSKEEIRTMRGKKIAMIFQDPMAALDPVYTCGHQMREAILAHERLSKREALEKSIDMLESMGIHEPKKCLDSYPFELSGGMCQRVMIAMSLLCSPELLIADEPTTALDVTVQAQILELLQKIREERHMGIIIITHDLGVVSEITDRVAVMYAGKIMEVAETKDLLRNPMHPYTQGLLKSMIRLNQLDERLYMIKGTVPDLSSLPSGCRFSTRCPIADERCAQGGIDEVLVSRNHSVRCLKISTQSKEGSG